MTLGEYKNLVASLDGDDSLEVFASPRVMVAQAAHEHFNDTENEEEPNIPDLARRYKVVNCAVFCYIGIKDGKEDEFVSIVFDTDERHSLTDPAKDF